ncbi:MAG: DUF255 domain-containing protein [Isosphaeraceae bacterium]
MHRLMRDRNLPSRPCLSWILLVAAALLAPYPAETRSQEAGRKPEYPPNRLAKETSPYLLLHAHNPVDWYPWGPEAFAKARAEGRPIFLSVGYSSCYWCHVMERESFSDAEIAKFLNENFVCIKVDREERPDVDQVYMAALQAFSTGGWPMSMFLLPDGRPFYGETYLPPRDRDGAAGFLTVTKGIARAWKAERAEIEKSAGGLTEIVKRKLGNPAGRRRPPLSRQFAAAGRDQLAEQFDPEYGGFGFSPQNARRPKFPEPVNLIFLLDQHRRDAMAAPRNGPAGAQAQPLPMVVQTLDRMARGGIRDQIGGGYHRYSTSRYWIVPHFEKMLYDNAQLASAQLMAYEITRDDRWRNEAEAIFAFVARTMTSEEGGFFSALDAETAEGEGAYYVWTRDEARQVLGDGPDSEAFQQVYGLKREPNFEGNRYVLLQPRPLAEQAEKLGTTPDELERRLKPLRDRLLAARDRRPAPLRDDKILTAWNGLMIAAYADGYRILKNESYRRAAERSAEFLLAKSRDPGGRLLRTYRAGQARLAAYLEDYAFLIHGLLKLHTATGEARWLEQARVLADRMVVDFADTEEGGFFFTPGDHESLLARPKDPYDGALPGANSMAVLDLLGLHRVTSDERYLTQARKTLEAFSAVMVQNPAAMPIMLLGLQDYLDDRPDRITPKPLGEGALAPTPARVVSGTARSVSPKLPAPGQVVEALVALEVKKGWHIYANPTGVEILKPTTLELEGGPPATDLKVTYPKGQAKVLGSLGQEKVSLYEGKVEIPVRLTLAKHSKPGKLALRFRLKYQACDDKVCLAPASLTIPLELDIQAASSPGGQTP